MYIGLISDTHGSFDPEIREFLAPVDELWHAGDFGAGAEFAASIAAFKPLVGVYGNCDGQDIRHLHPSYQYFEPSAELLSGATLNESKNPIILSSSI